MATKRKPIRSTSSSNMNFRPSAPELKKNETRGTRPASSPTSVREIFITLVMHICKKTMFYDINLKVALYLGSMFIISLIGDFIPFPKTYFARSDNLFNVYFVKIGWGWTLLFCTPFLLMTSYTLCCGNMRKTVQHLPRIFIATFFWYFWTKLFHYIETNYGHCTAKGFTTKSSCLRAGYLWNGFDISGHAFILIHSSLVLIEEARPIVKWQSIREHLRNEMHDRSVADGSISSNPLRYLNNDQMYRLRFLYEKFTPIIRMLFIGMAALQLLWDVMLVGTMLYFHNMVEKVLSGVIAILTWYFTYRFWYPSSILPVPAGCGCFIYQQKSSHFQTKHLFAGFKL